MPRRWAARSSGARSLRPGRPTERARSSLHGSAVRFHQDQGGSYGLRSVVLELEPAVRYGEGGRFMLTEQQDLALARIAAAAVASERETGLPAEISAAQCIFESAWLARCPGNNCFGIMPDHHGAGTQYFLSHEYLNGSWIEKQEAFEKYDALA